MIRVGLAWLFVWAGSFVWWSCRWYRPYNRLMVMSGNFQGDDPRGPWKPVNE